VCGRTTGLCGSRKIKIKIKIKIEIEIKIKIKIKIKITPRGPLQPRRLLPTA
jgi:hypothetical protein